MIEFESEQVVHEVLASVPFTFGYHPRESVVVTTLTLGTTHVVIGASARLDLADLEHPAAPLVVDHACGALARTGSEAALVTIHTERQIDLWVLDLADLVTSRWPFAEHGGYYVLSQGTIHGFAPNGEPRGCRDALELLTTRVAMSQPAREFASGPQDFLFPRTPEGATAARFAESLAEFRAGERGPWAELTHQWHRSVRSGGPGNVRAQAGLLYALGHPPFRDGAIAWVLGGAAAPVADLTSVDPAWMLDRPRPPDHLLLERVYGTLARTARFAPRGQAAAPLGMAAYLAWYAGDGARARVLCHQALDEDPGHSLAGLVEDALARACPPPWYHSAA